MSVSSRRWGGAVGEGPHRVTEGRQGHVEADIVPATVFYITSIKLDLLDARLFVASDVFFISRFQALFLPSVHREHVYSSDELVHERGSIRRVIQEK